MEKQPIREQKNMYDSSLQPESLQSNDPVQKKQTFSYWLHKNSYYHHRVKRFYAHLITPHASVLHLNCKSGHLLKAVNPVFGVGIDSDGTVLETARHEYPEYQFFECTVDHLTIKHQFDYIILPMVLMETDDIQTFLQQLHPFCHAGTRIIIETYSHLWEPVLWVTQKLGLRHTTTFKNWVSRTDLQNFLYLAGFESITSGSYMLLPVHIPFISYIANVWLAPLPIIRHLCLHQWLVARPIPLIQSSKHVSVSVIITCRNERGNVERAVQECPSLGSHTEIIFVEGGSSDGTLDEIKRVTHKYTDKNITWLVQDGVGKGDAVRKGFAHARGDILMILDGDLTMPAQELPKFFDAIISGKGEFINGSRLVYGMESDAMRFLNVIVNFFFGKIFSWLLGQPVKDTLCGTKVLWKKDYERIVAQQVGINLGDPFGDFDLLFGAAKLNLKIIDMPIPYKNRTYGQTSFIYMNRFKHGFLLLLVSIRAMKIFKFR